MVINQPHSIGDILFIEPICRHFWQKNGDKPILPVRDHLMWMADYYESARLVSMSQFSLDYESMETSNPDYLPLRFANQIIRGLDKNEHSDFANCMPDKYALAGLRLDEWKEMEFNVNTNRCYELINKLGIHEFVPFILINEYCQIGKVSINPANPHFLPIIRMEVIPGYRLLDWFLVFKWAKEIHTVSTSTFYLMELVKTEAKVFIYPRPNEDGLQGISKLKPSFDFTLMP